MEELLKSLGQNGPAWTLVALLFLALWVVIKMLISEKDKRIEAAEKVRDEVANPLKNINDRLDLLTDILTNSPTRRRK
jgi:sensor domain CHASE-containing protein